MVSLLYPLKIGRYDGSQIDEYVKHDGLLLVLG